MAAGLPGQVSGYQQYHALDQALSLNSALARCRHPNGLDLLASQFFVCCIFLFILGLEQLLTDGSCPASSLPGAAGGQSRTPMGLSRQSSGTKEGKNRDVQK